MDGNKLKQSHGETETNTGYAQNNGRRGQGTMFIEFSKRALTGVGSWRSDTYRVLYRRRHHLIGLSFDIHAEQPSFLFERRSKMEIYAAIVSI